MEPLVSEGHIVNSLLGSRQEELLGTLEVSQKTLLEAQVAGTPDANCVNLQKENKAVWLRQPQPNSIEFNHDLISI